VRISELKKYVVALALSLSMIPAAHALVVNQEDGNAGRQSTPAAQSPDANEGVVDENDKYRKSPMVAKLGGMMGMKPDTAATTFEVLNFGVLAALVVYFLGKALPKTFKDRNSAIQKHLVDARIATEEASVRMSGIEDRLAALDGQIAELRAQSERDSAADEVRIKASVEDEKAKILASADQEIAAATLHAQRQLQQYAAELAIEQAAKKLTISAETDRLLVRDFARRLGSDDLKGGQN
jgi:F-type H+-transporting ATPase subunit b